VAWVDPYPELSMAASPGSRRLLLLLASLILASIGLLLSSLRLPAGAARIPSGDFVEYWAAGRLVMAGGNPYDPEQVEQMERQAGREGDFILMWNPPWALTLVLPLGLLDFAAARSLWLVAGFLILGACADLLWRLAGGPAEQRWLSWLLALTFLPASMALIVGQITPFVLLGAVGFLWQLERRHDFLAGAATVLLAIKPHLAYLFWIALLVWVIQQRRWRVLTGAVLAAGIGTAGPLACNPELLKQYADTFLHRPPAQYRSPTLGTLVRDLLGQDRFHLQMASMLPGLVWLFWRGLRQRGDWRWSEQMPVLLLVSVITAAYGAWLFDLVLLLVPVVLVAARLYQSGRPSLWTLAGGLYLLVNGIALVQLLSEVEYFAYIWLAPALLLLWAFLLRLQSAMGAQATSASQLV
jgi:hypothetical protein